MNLEGAAFVWFQNEDASRKTADPTFAWDIDNITDALKTFYTKPTRTFDSFKVLMDLRQTTSVRDYAQQFLLLKLEVTLEEAFLLNLFIKGLKPHTATEVRLREPANLMKAIEYAQIIDDTRFATRYQPNHSYQHPRTTRHTEVITSLINLINLTISTTRMPQDPTKCLPGVTSIIMLLLPLLLLPTPLWTLILSPVQEEEAYRC